MFRIVLHMCQEEVRLFDVIYSFVHVLTLTHRAVNPFSAKLTESTWHEASIWVGGGVGWGGEGLVPGSPSALHIVLAVECRVKQLCGTQFCVQTKHSYS